MDLIERYLHAVRTYLPKAQQDDIIRELSDDLHAQAHEREAALRRPLTVDEQAAIVRPYGRPMLLAARYRPKQYLIGPAVFPFYVNVLKIAVLLALAVHVVLSVVLAATGSALSTSLGVLTNLPGVAVVVLGWVTVVFAVIDRFVPAAAADNWNPRSLPPVPADRVAVPRSDSAVELVTTAAAVCWLLAVPGNPWLILGPGTAMLALGPGWDSAYMPLLVLMGFSIAQSLVDVTWPYRTRSRILVRTAAHAASLALVLFLIRVGDFVVLAAGVEPSYQRAVNAVNGSVEVGLAISAIILLVELGKDVLRLRRIAGPAVPSLV